VQDTVLQDTLEVVFGVVVGVEAEVLVEVMVEDGGGAIEILIMYHMLPHLFMLQHIQSLLQIR
jgi:hypothetical protein